MTIKFSRAQRRHDYARLKKKRQYHWGYGHKSYVFRPLERGEICFMDPDVAGSVVNTPTPCSCAMCGNLRRTLMDDSPLTMQERKAYDRYLDQLEEYYNWDWDDEDYMDYIDSRPEI